MFLRSLLPLFFVTLFLCQTTPVEAQSGMTYEEFVRKIEPYFADDLISDIRAALPQGSHYRIWGWDVGDFSGDGIYDLALTVNILGTRKKECIAYLFVDNEGFLVNITAMPFQYVELPLEIGVVIRNGTCSITQKRRADDWVIRGYRFEGGSVVLVDEFVSDKRGMLGHETFTSYNTLETREQFLDSDGDPVFAIEYLTIPCYSRSRQVHAGFLSEVSVEGVSYVREGAFWWSGPSDASFRARAVFDDEFLYLRVNVADSTIVTGWCDTCAADRLEIWIDMSQPESSQTSRYISKIDRSVVSARVFSDSGLYAFSIRIGDFGEKRPSIRVKTTDELDPDQEAAIKLVRVVTTPRSDGYVVKVRIPFRLLGFERAPIDDRVITELGFTIALYDVDNEFRPEETTILSTSPLDPLNPSTYGAIRFIPDGKWYGETTNIYTSAVLSALRELGF